MNKPALPNDEGARLTALEIKASYTELLLEQLDQVVIQQQQQIDLLMREVTRLARSDPSQDNASPAGRHELPPHY